MPHPPAPSCGFVLFVVLTSAAALALVSFGPAPYRWLVPTAGSFAFWWRIGSVTVATVAAVTDTHCATAAVVVLLGPAAHVLAAAASNPPAPLAAASSASVFTSAGSDLICAFAFAAPLVGCSTSRPLECLRRIASAAIVAITAACVVVAVAVGIVFGQAPTSSDWCVEASTVSLRWQLLSLVLGLGAPSLVWLCSHRSGAATTAQSSAVATVLSFLWIGVALSDDWRSFSAMCPSLNVPGFAHLGSTPCVAAQLLRVVTVAVVLPLMFLAMVTSVKAAADGTEASDPDHDEKPPCPCGSPTYPLLSHLPLDSRV